MTCDMWHMTCDVWHVTHDMRHVSQNFSMASMEHSQLLNIIILKLYSPVFLTLLCNIFLYCPAVGAIHRVNPSNIDLQEGQCCSCNWECLNCDSSRDRQSNIAWALWKSLWLCPRAHAIFHCISLLLQQYRFSLWILGRPMQNRLWILGRPIQNHLCILGGPPWKPMKNWM